MMNLYTPIEIAEMLKVPVEKVRVMIREKRLEGVKVGMHWRVTEKAINEFIEKNSNMEGEQHVSISEDIRERIEFINEQIFDKKQSMKRNKGKIANYEDVALAYITALEGERAYLWALLQKYEK